MKTLVAFPPNYSTIAKAFGLRGRPAIFSYGDTIFNPYRLKITPELQAHEEVHGERQLLGGVEDWWEMYIDSVAFRMQEEILAHRAEFKTFCGRVSSGLARTKALAQMSYRLSGPLYGRVITHEDAIREILK